MSLSGPAPSGGVSFSVATSDGTATAGTIYVALSQSLSIPAGSSDATFA